jgi:hypothetical protein
VLRGLLPSAVRTSTHINRTLRYALYANVKLTLPDNPQAAFAVVVVGCPQQSRLHRTPQKAFNRRPQLIFQL